MIYIDPEKTFWTSDRRCFFQSTLDAILRRMRIADTGGSSLIGLLEHNYKKRDKADGK